MPFIATFMLWGSLAAAVPIAIHLFFRSRYRTVPWAAMKFLLTSVEQTSRRLKFQEYLLLMLRVSVLVFLAMAMARPVNLTTFGYLYLIGAILFTIVTVTWALAPLWKVASSWGANIAIFAVSQLAMIGVCATIWTLFAFVLPVRTEVVARGQGDAIDAVFVFDTSYSMGAGDGARSRIERAQDEALKIIDELPPRSTVQIVTCAGNTKAALNPRTPANLDQARELIRGLELADLATDLAVGVAEAQDILARGQASNKELYVFSDMQKLGFEQQAGPLKSILEEVKKKAAVHFVRCGTRTFKNVAVVGIVPQMGIPRPKERVGFAVLLKNTGAEPIENLRVTLAVDGDEKNLEPQVIPKLDPQRTYAATLSAKFDKPGLRLLTAKVTQDDLDGDNRFDQVILVRDQVNILVVDGKHHEGERDAEKSSSYHLMHSLVPVHESQRANYRYNPRVIPARLAQPAQLVNQDICILVNCSLKPRAGVNAETLPGNFVEALGPFVRDGHGLIVISGDHVQPGPYNQILGDELGLLPMALTPVVSAVEKQVPGKLGAPNEMERVPYQIDRKSFGQGPPAFWNFKDDTYYKSFDFVEVWQHLGIDETKIPKRRPPPKKDDDAAKDEKAPPPPPAEDDAVSVIVRLNSGKPLAVSRKVDSGEVIFFATAAHDEGFDPKTLDPNWTNINRLPPLLMFLDVSIAHLMHGQTQTYNLVAGQALQWFPKDKLDHAYYLVHPGGKRVDRLGLPERIDRRLVVTANDLPRAGVYYMTSTPREINEAVPATAKTKMPVAVIPDLAESADLTALTPAEIDARLGFTPIHIVAGEAKGALTSAERTNREWTMIALLMLGALVLFEVAFAWWCGRAW